MYWAITFSIDVTFSMAHVFAILDSRSESTILFISTILRMTGHFYSVGWRFMKIFELYFYWTRIFSRVKEIQGNVKYLRSDIFKCLLVFWQGMICNLLHRIDKKTYNRFWGSVGKNCWPFLNKPFLNLFFFFHLVIFFFFLLLPVGRFDNNHF